MKLNRQSIRAAVLVMMLVLAACEGDRPQLEIKLKPDYSQIISEIKGVSTALSEKLAAIEKTLSGGFSDNAAALAAIKAAVSSLEGTAAEKLAAIEAAVKAQTASLETKLALVEAAVESGFADTAAAQGLIKDAIDALKGSAEEKLAAIEAAVKAQTASLEAKLALVETAVKDGFVDNAAAQGLIKDAIDALKGSAEEKLAAIDAAVKAQTASLEAKLALVETAVETGFADSAQAQGLIKGAIETLQGSAEEKLAAIAKAVTDQTTSFGTKLNTIEGAIATGFASSAGAQGLIEQAIKTLDSNTAGKLAEILQKITGLPNYSGDLNDIKNAIDTLRKMFVLGVSLDNTALTMFVGTRAVLTATVFPDDATDKSVTWKSSDATVAEVSQEGRVTARMVGNATITVTTVVGGNTATCELTVKDQEYVDLGLSVKWATMNVGANAPEEYGDYFAWGETEPKSDYRWSTYKYANGTEDKLTKYCQTSRWNYWAGGGFPDGKLTLDYDDDAARANWGGTWRMPTREEFQALIDNCTITWAQEGGVNGRKFTGPNGNSIFLPAAGRWDGSSRINGGLYGNYWSSSLHANYPDVALRLYFGSLVAGEVDFFGRCIGQSVRPVTE